MNLNKRLSELEIKQGINKPQFDSVMYREGEPIEYDGFTFDNEADLRAYGKSKNIDILPVCLVNARND